MKQKKLNRILSQFEHFLKGQNSFGIGLNENQRKDFIKYAKIVLDKKNKKEKPTFTQPKEVVEKAISYEFTEKGFFNGKTKEPNVTVLKTTGLSVDTEKAKGIIYYQSNGTCDVYIDEMYSKSIVIHIEDNFVAENVTLFKKRLHKIVNCSSILDKHYVQFGNRLIIG